MNIIIDDWWEMIIAGIIIIGVLFMLYKIVKLIISNGIKVNTKNLKIGGNMNDDITEIKNILKSMEGERIKARAEISESNKNTQKMFRLVITSIDSLMEAFQQNKIGNGNIEKGRKLIAQCYDLQDEYLINQL